MYRIIFLRIIRKTVLGIVYFSIISRKLPCVVKSMMAMLHCGFTTSHYWRQTCLHIILIVSTEASW